MLPGNLATSLRCGDVRHTRIKKITKVTTARVGIVGASTCRAWMKGWYFQDSKSLEDKTTPRTVPYVKNKFSILRQNAATRAAYRILLELFIHFCSQYTTMKKTAKASDSHSPSPRSQSKLGIRTNPNAWGTRISRLQRICASAATRDAVLIFMVQASVRA
jgi:hypothetical protein